MYPTNTIDEFGIARSLAMYFDNPFYVDAQHNVHTSADLPLLNRAYAPDDVELAGSDGTLAFSCSVHWEGYPLAHNNRSVMEPSEFLTRYELHNLPAGVYVMTLVHGPFIGCDACTQPELGMICEDPGCTYGQMYSRVVGWALMKYQD